MVIGVDCDGVLCDFNKNYINLVIDVTGRDLFPPRPFEIGTWNYPESFGYTKKEVSASWDRIKESDSFWFSLSSYGEEVEKFAEFLEIIEQPTYFITSRIGKDVKGQTEDWLYQHGFGTPTVLISSEKGECCHALNIDYYIDDKNENCQDVCKKSPDTVVCMLARPWNQFIDIPRIKSLTNFMEVINGGSESV